MKKLLCLLLLLMCLSAAALAETAADVSGIVVDAFLKGDYAKVESMLSDEVRAAIGAEQLQQAWEMQIDALGAFVEILDVQTDGAMEVLTLGHEEGAQNLIIATNEQGKIEGLLLQPAFVERTTVERILPEGSVEREIVLFEGTEKAVNGKVIAPAAVDAPYVVLVHGSGPSDMDETLYGNKPFRDIAYDLAELGVGSIRFDKMTYAHPELSYETVVQEYLEPVAEALRVLKELTGASKVYVLGHSQGGMLMPWLVRECGFDGGVALAGSPRTLWEISYQQNLNSIAFVPADMQEAALGQVEQERVRAQALADMPDDEARVSTVFGMNAYYLKHMAALDQLSIAKETGKPMLFLWGEADVQVTRADFEAWQNGLGESRLYTYISYPELNHLFMTAQEGENISNVMNAYAKGGYVDQRVAQDIAAWMMGIE